MIARQSGLSGHFKLTVTTLLVLTPSMVRAADLAEGDAPTHGPAGTGRVS